MAGVFHANGGLQGLARMSLSTDAPGRQILRALPPPHHPDLFGASPRWLEGQGFCWRPFHHCCLLYLQSVSTQFPDTEQGEGTHQFCWAAGPNPSR